MTDFHAKFLIFLVLAIVALSACGGGGGSGTPPPIVPPPPAPPTLDQNLRGVIAAQGLSGDPTAAEHYPR